MQTLSQNVIIDYKYKKNTVQAQQYYLMSSALNYSLQSINGLKLNNRQLLLIFLRLKY